VQRVCFVLRVKPDRVAEYRVRHQEVWPEMQDALRESGWSNYTIFVVDDGLVVGYLETPNFDSARATMATTEVNARWQREMAAFFEDLDGRAPDAAMRPLPEAFHLD
jgi:L-rhamnose mutarotase